MRLSILATDSRGVIQPLVAVAVALRRRGHAVRFVTHERFRGFIDANELEFAPLPDQPRGGWGSPDVEQFATIAAKARFARGVARALLRSSPARSADVARAAPSFIQRLWSASWDACRGSDGVIFNQTSAWGCIIAEKLAVPGICTGFFPMTRTRAFPHFLLLHLRRRWRLGGRFNTLSYDLIDRATWNVARGMAAGFRKQLELPPLPLRAESYRVFQEMPILYGISPLVLPRPLDWPAHHQLTGYWFLDAPSDWQPAPDLVDFLAAGPPPVCVGFGSMTGGNTAALTELVVGALSRAGQRGLLLTGWGGLQTKNLPSGFHAVEEAPHEWLFPKVAAVVHHGGCGTTAAGLRAGVPSVVTPWLGGDQPFWAERVVELECGPRAPSKSGLTIEKLADAVRDAVTDPRFREQARRMGERLRAEDGVARAVDVIEGHMGAHVRKGSPA